MSQLADVKLDRSPSLYQKFAIPRILVSLLIKIRVIISSIFLSFSKTVEFLIWEQEQKKNTGTY